MLILVLLIESSGILTWFKDRKEREERGGKLNLFFEKLSLEEKGVDKIVFKVVLLFVVDWKLKKSLCFVIRDKFF